MLTRLISLASILMICSCTDSGKEIKKHWLNTPIDLQQLEKITNYYHMCDSTGQKVGSMIFGWSYIDDMLIARDTSFFDDSSVYETAELGIDTSDFLLRYLKMDMEVGGTVLHLDFEKENGRITGTYDVKRDTIRRLNEVDSLYAHDVFREEIYAMLPSLILDSDTLRIKAFLSTALDTAEAKLYSADSESIEVPYGNFDCEVLWLTASGGMPSNKIWINYEQPRRIVKFYVPGPELTIELIESRNSTF